VDGPNSYEYALSSPTQWIDPEGTQVGKNRNWQEVPGAEAALAGFEKWHKACLDSLCLLPEGWSVIGTEWASAGSETYEIFGGRLGRFYVGKTVEVAKVAYVLGGNIVGPIVDLRGEHEREFLLAPALRLVKGDYTRIEAASKIMYSENKGWLVEWWEVGPYTPGKGLWTGPSGRAESTISPIEFVGQGLATRAGRFLAGAGPRLAGARLMAGFSEGAKRAIRGPWRVFGNNLKLLRNPRTRYGIRNIFWDPRNFKAVSQQYWRISGGAQGKSLQHLFFQNQTTWISQGLRNAGFNLLEIPAGLNTWMGGRLARELTFRATVLGMAGGSGYGAYRGTRLLTDPLILGTTDEPRRD
jgi:hypothetical protein